MCTEVYVNGVLCGNVGELKDAIGEIVFDGDQQELRECLCPLDCDKTAALHGMRVVSDYEKYGFGIVAFEPA